MILKKLKKFIGHPAIGITSGVLLTIIITSFMTDVVFGFKQRTLSHTLESNNVIPENGTVVSSPTPFLPIPTSTPTQTPPPSPTAFPSPTNPPTYTPEPISIANLPESAKIEGFIGHPQYYNLDCEARSAVDWAGFFGYAINEMDFLKNLPKSDNPDKGFVGYFWDMPGNTPPLSYGVHAGPVAELLRDYDVPANAIKGLTWEDLQLEIAQGRPVITWVIYQLSSSQSATYIDEEGETVTVAPFEHTVVVTGFQEGFVWLVDGNMERIIPIDQFLISWEVLGNMAIIFKE